MAQRSPQSFDAMRQDAIRRSREMQRRAMPPPEPPALPQQPAPEAPAADMTGLLKALHSGEGLQSLLRDWDGEKLALAGLLYLLYKEGADPVLLLAIGYILL